MPPSRAVLRRLFSRLALRLGLLGVAAALCSRVVDPGATAASLRAADPGLLAAGFGLTVGGWLTGVLQWGVVLRRATQRIAWIPLLGTCLRSLCFAQIVPGGFGGDAARAVEMSRRDGYGPVLASIAASRTAGAIAIALWGLAAAVVGHDHLGWAPAAGAGGLLAILVVAAVAAGRAGDVVGGWPARCLPEAARRRLLAVASPLAGYRRRPLALVASLAVAGLSWGFNLFAMVAFAAAIGTHVPWTVFAVAIPLALTATVIPISVNGIGVKEGVLVGLLGRAGMTGGHAASLAVLVDVQYLPLVLVGLALWLGRRAPRPARLRS